jgi:hypothetical protein
MCWLLTVAQILDASRRRLADVTRERTRVLDLVCHDPAPASDPDIDVEDVDPLGAYTPEVDEALNEARNAIAGSTEARRSADRLLETVRELEQTVWKTVNAGLNRKVTETAKLKVRRRRLTRKRGRRFRASSAQRRVGARSLRAVHRTLHV